MCTPGTLLSRSRASLSKLSSTSRHCPPVGPLYEDARKVSSPTGGHASTQLPPLPPLQLDTVKIRSDISHFRPFTVLIITVLGLNNVCSQLTKRDSTGKGGERFAANLYTRN